MSDDMQRLLAEQSAYLLGRDSEADRIRDLEAENARLHETLALHTKECRDAWRDIAILRRALDAAEMENSALKAERAALSSPAPTEEG